MSLLLALMAAATAAQAPAPQPRGLSLREAQTLPAPVVTALGTYTNACVVCPIGTLAITRFVSVSMTAAVLLFSRAT